MSNVADRLHNDRLVELLGIEILDENEQFPSCQLKVCKKHLNGVDYTQGGAIFTLADYAFAIASNTDQRLSLGISTTMNFFKATKEGDILYTKTRELSRTKKLSIYEVEIYCEDALIATFTGTAYKVADC
ncbi:MAG: hotdog fold thioesterase [Kiritimatiellae bacterium]|jgi:acyl-CoA thioesterase|nr:hotdog fold thioesterase [Kiritimatiellia bacterium]